MKNRIWKFGWILMLSASVGFTACHSKTKDTTDTTTQNTGTTTNMDSSSNAANGPVDAPPDDQLRTEVKDAVKDYPGVNATVNNGEINLTGTIKRDKLPRLMMSLNSLEPKKINNNLTVK